ncbi:MAG: hypothetical protein NDI91_19845 [Sulfuritalea sp.]|nr:hypothetical protein [Sulfuritalea sp.]
MTDKRTTNPGPAPTLTLVERHPSADALAAFIAEAKALTVFGADLVWADWKWAGVATFTKQGALKSSRQKTIDPDRMLHPDFIDFAKAYVRHAESDNPSLANRKKDLGALRLIECALEEEGAGGDPTQITLHTLGRAARLALESSGIKYQQYAIGRCLERLAKVLQRRGLTRNAVGSFVNPNPVPQAMGIRLGKEADEHRAKYLPDERALIAINSVFAHIAEPERPDNHRDVFVTGSLVLYEAGSKRGNELFETRIDALFSETDNKGKEQWGLRWRSFKNPNDPTRISWFSEEIAPFAIEAYQRIVAITEEPRTFAKYCETQLTLRDKNRNDPRLRFYRHPGCPDVPDNQPLTKLEVLAALGSASTHESALRRKGLKSRAGTYTLNSLWLRVLDRLPKGFPYVKGAKDKRLKYSEALFCMHPFQLKHGENSTTDPVGVWRPDLNTLSHHLMGRKESPSFFERYRAMDENGNPVRLASHQIRHLIDTFGHESTGEHFLSKEAINALAGRAKDWQGNTYNHVLAGEYAERARRATQQADGRNPVFDLPVPARPATDDIALKHWSVRLRPRSCAEVDMHYRSATIATLWGGCEHDWLIKPCPYSRDCLNCTSHVCIKGLGKDDQERLERLKKFLDKIVIQQGLAQAAFERGDPGTSFWVDYQTVYRERVEGLIILLESSEYPQGTEFRLKGTSNTHLHRVLQRKVLESVEQKMIEADAVAYLLSAYRENRALPLEAAPDLLEHRHGT